MFGSSKPRVDVDASTGGATNAAGSSGRGTGGAAASGAAGGGGDGAAGSGGESAAGGDTSSSGGEGGTTSAGGDTSGGAPASGGTSDGAAGAAGSAGKGDGGAPPSVMGCRTNGDCAAVAGKPLCDASKTRCIACHTNAQCAATQECVNSECVPLSPCKSSLDCSSMKGEKTICDLTNKVCVQCSTAADCGAGKVCVNRTCRTSCSSDNDCSAQHMLCNKGLSFGSGQCTECTRTECPAGKYCESGTCVPLTCTPAQQSCSQNVVVQCNDYGSDVVPMKQCSLMPLAPACLVNGNNADCVGTCYDQRRDGLETDVDCGGVVCTRCGKGKSCTTNTDCASNKCTAGLCD